MVHRPFQVLNLPVFNGDAGPGGFRMPEPVQVPVRERFMGKGLLELGEGVLDDPSRVRPTGEAQHRPRGGNGFFKECRNSHYHLWSRPSAVLIGCILLDLVSLQKGDSRQLARILVEQ